MRQITKPEEAQSDRLYFVRSNKNNSVFFMRNSNWYSWWFDLHETFQNYSVYKIQTMDEFNKLSLLCKMSK